MVSPAGPARLVASTRRTGQRTKARSRSRIAATVAATTTSVFWRAWSRGWCREGRVAGSAVGGPGAERTASDGVGIPVVSSAGREAAVDDQLGPGHERGVVARQEERHRRDLARPGDPTERDPGLELLADRLGEVRGLERRVHDPWVNDVAADLVLRELDRQRLGQRDERALRGGVRVLGAREADERRDRAHQDHGATAGTLELGDPVLRHPEGGLEVDGDHAVPPLLVRLQHRAVAVLPEHARVVVEDVEPAEVAGAVLDHAADVRLDRDVTGRGEGAPAPPLDERDRLLRGLRVDVGDDDARALLREEHRSFPPDPHTASGDERNPARKPSGHLSLHDGDENEDAGGHAPGIAGPRGTRPLPRCGWAPPGRAGSVAGWRERVPSTPGAYPPAPPSHLRRQIRSKLRISSQSVTAWSKACCSSRAVCR